MPFNCFGIFENVWYLFCSLIAENQHLKILVENLMFDKLSQAQRIMEFNEEKSRLKKALADLILKAQS